MKNPNRPHAPASGSRQMAEETHVLDYVRVLYKRRWMGLPVFLIVFIVGALNALRQTPVYQGRTQLLIETDSPKVARLDQMFQSDAAYYDTDFYTTQYRILESRSLAKRAIDTMRLWDAPTLGNGPEPRGSLSVMGALEWGIASGLDLCPLRLFSRVL